MIAYLVGRWNILVLFLHIYMYFANLCISSTSFTVPHSSPDPSLKPSSFPPSQILLRAQQASQVYSISGRFGLGIEMKVG